MNEKNQQQNGEKPGKPSNSPPTQTSKHADIAKTDSAKTDSASSTKDDPWHIRSQLPAGALDDKFSVFHRPTRHMIGIDLTQGGTQVSMFFRDRQNIVNLTLKDKFRRRPHSGDESDDSVPSMQSVQELMWKELRPLRIAEIPDLYMRLAKVRLTGELRRFSFLKYCYFWFFKPEMK